MKKLVILSILVIFTSIGCDTIKVKYGNKGDNKTIKPKNELVESGDNISKPITSVEDINNIMNDNDSNYFDNNTAIETQNNNQLLLDNGFGATTLNSYINRYNILEKNMENNFMLFDDKITYLENNLRFYQTETDNLSVKIANLNNHINNLTIENNASIELVNKFKNYIVIFFIVILVIIVSLIFVIISVYVRLGKIKSIIQKEPVKHSDPVKHTEPTTPTDEKKKVSTRKNMTIIDTTDDESNNNDDGSKDNK